jgi:hypothetical protein
MNAFTAFPIPNINIPALPDLGAVTDACSFVGENAGSGRFTAPALASYLTSGVLADELVNNAVMQAMIINQGETGHFYQDQGGHINRMADRLFVGAAVVNDGHASPTTMDWLSYYVSWSVLTSTFASLSHVGGIGVIGASQNADRAGLEIGSYYPAAIGVAGWGINNDSTATNSVWAMYAEGRREQPGNSATFTLESEIMNLTGAMPAATPYSMIPTGLTAGLWLGSGGGASNYGQTAYAATMAIGILNNEGTFQSGIVFGKDALTGGNGTVGTFGEAIAMATGHNIRWYHPDGTAGPFIRSSDATPHQVGILFQAGAILLGNSPDLNTGLAVQVVPVQNGVNIIDLVGSVAGSPPTIGVGGSDADIDLYLAPKGAGIVRFGNPSAAALTPSAFSATHTIALRDGNGLTVYLPCSTVGW